MLYWQNHGANLLSLSLSLENASVVLRAKEAFALWTNNVVPHMPRTSRYTTGARIETHFLDLLEAIYQAYYAPLESKSPFIVTAINKNDLVKYFLQIAWENKLIKDKPYIEISEKIQEVGRILGGWKNKVNEKITHSKQSMTR